MRRARVGPCDAWRARRRGRPRAPSAHEQLDVDRAGADRARPPASKTSGDNRQPGDHTVVPGATISAVRRCVGGDGRQRGDVDRCRGPRSSSRRRPDDPAGVVEGEVELGPGHAGSLAAGAVSGWNDVSTVPSARRTAWTVAEPVLVVALGEVRPQVAAAGLLAQGGHGGQDLAEVEQVRRLPGGGLGVGAVGLGGLGQRGQLVVRSGQRLGRRARHRCRAVIARWTSRRCSAGDAARSRRWARRGRPEQLAGGEPRGDVVGDPVGEDQPLEQRVGGQPVGAVDAGARDLAARVQAVQARTGRAGRCATPPLA